MTIKFKKDTIISIIEHMANEKLYNQGGSPYKNYDNQHHYFLTTVIIFIVITINRGPGI